MKSKFLVKLAGREQAGHVLEKAVHVGDAVTAHVMNQDGSKTLFSGRVERILARMPISKREQLILDQDLLGLDDDQLARLLKTDKLMLELWTTGKKELSGQGAELLRIAVWLRDEHPAAWRAWRRRFDRQPTDGDDDDDDRGDAL